MDPTVDVKELTHLQLQAHVNAVLAADSLSTPLLVIPTADVHLHIPILVPVQTVSIQCTMTALHILDLTIIHHLVDATILRLTSVPLLIQAALQEHHALTLQTTPVVE